MRNFLIQLNLDIVFLGLVVFTGFIDEPNHSERHRVAICVAVLDAPEAVCCPRQYSVEAAAVFPDHRLPVGHLLRRGLLQRAAAQQLLRHAVRRAR